MIINSKCKRIFKSNNLTRHKYDELYDFAILIRNHKNEVSQYVNKNIFHFLGYTKFLFVKEMRECYKGTIPSSFDAQLYIQVFTCYNKRFEAITKKTHFDFLTFRGFEFYKKNCNKHKKGDLKRVVFEKGHTKLSSCLTYLARYGKEDTIQYINSNIDSCDEKKKSYYTNILRCCEKFGFKRLYNLALAKRKRVIKHYSEHPIEFKSLSFSGRSRRKKIIDYNSRFGSVVNSFVCLSWSDRKSYYIPVVFNKDWHGSIKEYRKSNNDYEYTITFNEKKHQVNIALYLNANRFVPEAHGNVIGIDVNCKHNLFSLSDGTTYNYDKKLVNDFCRLSLIIDKLQEKKGYIVGKRKRHKIDVMKSKMIKSEQQLISAMCKRLQSDGVGHIVMEDLSNDFGKCYIDDKENGGINYSRKVRFIGLSNLKNEVKHIAKNYNIAVSTVHASYTSKMCPVCGCIEDGNRPDQETFECVECGHKDNADFNAAKNIKNRVLVTVLRDSLLKRLDNGAYEPKKLSKDKVKEVLLSFRRSLSKGSECINCISNASNYV